MLIETDRLTIKKMDLKDSNELYKYRSDPAVYKYQSWLPNSVEEAEDFIRKYPADNKWIPGEWKQVGIYLNNSGQLIGDIGIHVIDINEFELGFSVSPEHQKKGYGYEAVTAVINTLLVEEGINHFTAQTDPENLPSITLLEKIGFEMVEHRKNSCEIRGELKDDLVFSLTL